MSRERYSLRQLVDMTGVSEFTLRGWELRYGAFAPNRTETGRRQYSAQDLQKAILLRELLQRNFRIGEIAHLTLVELRKRIETGKQTACEVEVSHALEIQAVLKHAVLQEWSQLDAKIRAHFKKNSPLASIQKFIVPLLESIGLEVSQNRLGIAQEHVLSAMIKQTLHKLTAQNLTTSGPKLVFATPEGDYHELGILTAQAIASQLKVGSLYLGPNTPKRELCETVTRLNATHLVIGSSVTKKEGAKEDFYSYVHFLDQNIPKHVNFWFGGRACETVELKREAHRFSSLREFREVLGRLAKVQRHA